MNSEKLDQKIRDYYGAEMLEPGTVAQIVASTKIVKSPWWRKPGAVVLAALLAVLGIVSALLLQGPSFSEEVVSDVVRNHRQAIAPEILSADLPEIGAGLPRLSFPLDPAPEELLASMRIEGGRYCSVHDELAAQITMRGPDGVRCSLYVAPLTEGLERFQPGEYEVDGASVTVERFGGRVYVLVQ